MSACCTRQITSTLAVFLVHAISPCSNRFCLPPGAGSLRSHNCTMLRDKCMSRIIGQQDLWQSSRILGKVAASSALSMPETAHVREFDLQSAPYPETWAYAAIHGYTIATKGAYIHHRSLIDGHPPEVIWTRLGIAQLTISAELLSPYLAYTFRVADDPLTTFLITRERTGSNAGVVGPLWPLP